MFVDARGFCPRHPLNSQFTNQSSSVAVGHAFEVVNAGVRDKRLEFEPRIVVVPEQPVDHVSAVACTGGTDTCLVDVRL